ncbi:hypothetical protein M0R72_12325 [Candidatus Pacearchaeota archaeon]|jgi:hypothetical protein|nr:hypothetical protein [Candidatus Pacearchaeota archaeon]
MQERFYFYDGTDYHRFLGRIESLKQYSQTPIKADEMVVRIAKDTPAPAFEEVVFTVDDSHIFHGLITKIDDLGNSQKLTCKSMQYLLDYRVIPYYVYYNVDLNTIFSSNVPSTAMGLGLLVNGYIPNGKWTYHNATVRKLVDGGLKSCFGSKDLYASTSFPNAGTIDDLDGVIQLTDAGAIPTADDTYYRTVDDLYVLVGDGSYRENATVIVAKDWCDTRIRFHSCDIGTYKSAASFSVSGQASRILDDLAQKLGRECEFLPWDDGTLRYILADEVPGRSSEASPVRSYIDGKNAKITISDANTPDVHAAVSYSSNICEAPQILTDWGQGIQLLKCYQNQGYTSDEVLLSLQGILDNNELSCTVVTSEMDYYLRPGDWVGLYRADVGNFSLRVREKQIVPGKMTLTCGKKMASASTVFGAYLRGEINDDKQPRCITTLGTNTEFEVSSENYALGGLKIYYEEAFSKTDDTDVDPTAFFTLEINGTVVPPGRILMSKAESVKIDITDYSTLPGTSTVLRTMYNSTGWVAGDQYVKQYLAVQFFAP